MPPILRDLDTRDLPVRYAPILLEIERLLVARKDAFALIGPPGSGTIALARRVAGLLPLQVVDAFRAPHHTTSAAGLAYARGRAGEVDRAVGGVLFLDEVTEFSRMAIEAVAIRRRELAAARPLLIVSTMACPGGCPSMAACSCNQVTRDRWYTRYLEFAARLGIDHAIEVPMLGLGEIASIERCEPSAAIRDRIIAGRAAS